MSDNTRLPERIRAQVEASPDYYLHQLGRIACGERVHHSTLASLQRDRLVDDHTRRLTSMGSVARNEAQQIVNDERLALRRLHDPDVTPAEADAFLEALDE